MFDAIAHEPAVLVVEDDPAIAETLVFALRQAGYFTHWVTEGKAALDWVQQRQVSSSTALPFLVLDVGLPDLNGFEVCRRLRQFSPAPVLFLTAHADEIDRVQGFEVGADDYLAKPFSPRELVARVRAILKRTRSSVEMANPAPAFLTTSAASTGSGALAASAAQQAATPSAEHSLQVGRIVLNKREASVAVDRQMVQLTRSEYRLLTVLMEHPRRVFSRDQLLDAAQGPGSPTGDRAIDTHIKSLRAKLTECAQGYEPIQTHRGLGYSFSPEA